MRTALEPDWLAAAHQWLPFQYMAQVHGAGHAETIGLPAGGVPALPFTVLAIRGLAGSAATARIMTRRT